MKLLRRSLAEDAVDGYNHTWSVLFVLLLAVITWPSALSSSLLSSWYPHSHGHDSVSPQYRATCWCPAHFSKVHVDYTNAVCASAYNNLVRGEASQSSAKLFEILPDEVPPDTYSNLAEQNRTSLGAGDFDYAANTERVKEKLSHFIFFETPLLLFMFAIILKLPHVLWLLLSSCCRLNVESTLETAVRGQTLDQDSRKKLNKELAQAVSKDMKQSRISAATLYVLMKLLALSVAVGEFVVTFIYLGKASTFKNDLSDVVSVRSMKENFGQKPLLCAFPITQVTNRHHYTVQCLFERTQAPDDNALELVLYEVFYTTLFVYFALLVTVNTLNLVSWLARLLVGSCRVSVSSGSELPVDGQLLLHMARLNAGPLVVQDMAEGVLGGARGTQEGTELEKLHGNEDED